MADLCITQLLHGHAHGYKMPYKPLRLLPSGQKDPWLGAVDVSFPWPQPRTNFVAEQLEAIHSREVYRLIASPQQSLAVTTSPMRGYA